MLGQGVVGAEVERDVGEAGLGVGHDRLAVDDVVLGPGAIVEGREADAARKPQAVVEGAPLVEEKDPERRVSRPVRDAGSHRTRQAVLSLEATRVDAVPVDLDATGEEMAAQRLRAGDLDAPDGV